MRCEFKPKYEGFGLCWVNRIEMNQFVKLMGAPGSSQKHVLTLKYFLTFMFNLLLLFMSPVAKTFHALSISLWIYTVFLTYFYISHCKFCLCSWESQAKSSCPVYTQKVTLFWLNFQRFGVSQSLNEVKYISQAKKVTRFVPNLRHKFNVRHHYTLCNRLLGKVLLGDGAFCRIPYLKSSFQAEVHSDMSQNLIKLPINLIKVPIPLLIFRHIFTAKQC